MPQHDAYFVRGKAPATLKEQVEKSIFMPLNFIQIMSLGLQPCVSDNN